MKKRGFALLLMGFALASCQGEGEASSLILSSSEEPEVSLAEAIENTKDDYALAVESSADYSVTFSIVAEDFYYYAPDGLGYCVLDDDPGYYHGFDLSMDESSTSSTDYIMTMYGRYAKSDNRDIYAYDFLETLSTYVDDFTEIGDGLYACTVTDLATDIRNFFQNRNYGYTNYFEVQIKGGRVDSLIPYEKTLEESYAYSTFRFTSFDKEEYAPYKEWKEAGSEVNLRIFDLKQGASSSLLSYFPLYQDDEVTFEGHVAGFDYAGAFYVTCKDESTGNVGIRVVLKDGDDPSLGDIVKVTGTVKKDGYVAYIDEATYERTGHQDSYPYFDEEAIANSYGGGYYAAYIFSQTPVYGDSIYSTYAYVESLPESLSEGKDDEAILIFPSQKDDSVAFHAKLVLPKEMPLEEKEAALETLKEFGIHGEEGALEAYFEKFILRFDASYEYCVALEYGLESKVSKSLSAEEKIYEAYGVEVPLIDTDTYVCFKFGSSTGYLIESYYGLSTSSAAGIYYYDPSVSETEWTDEQVALLEAGFSVYDGIKDIYGSKHLIFQKGDLVIDTLTYDNASYSGEEEYALYMWIYEGDVIRGLSIKETLTKNIPYFDADDFLIDGLYDYDFTYYQLPVYAGNVYEEGSYLNCVTMDVDNGDSYLLELTRKYMNESGYSLLRNDDNSMRRYVTRGSSHYILYKAIEGSEEKAFVDLALYSTDEYTYVGHDEFTSRVEILIYKATEPLSPIYDDDLGYLTGYVKEEYGIDLAFDISGDIQVENWYAAEGGSAYIDYGYLFQYNLYVYSSSVSVTLSEIQSSLLASGYSLSYTSSKGNYCYKNDSSYIFVMPNVEGGYIRLIDSVGGSNF